MEKLETVKQLVRANNYKDNDKTYQQCLELGVYVNRVGLEEFSRKLRSLDRNEEIDAMRSTYSPSSHSQSHKPTSNPISYEKSSYSFGQSSNVTQAVFNDRNGLQESSSNGALDNIEAMTSSSNHNISHARQYKEAKQREAEITFELGEMKIREFQLLQELNNLASHTGKIVRTG